MKRLEEWLFEKFAGKVLARAAVTFAAWVASTAVQGALARAGIHATVDPSELTTGMIAAGHAAFEWFKAWRASKKAGTQPSKPN